MTLFCKEKSGVSFPHSAKIDVNGRNAHPLYRYLKREKPGILGFVGNGAIRWNFTKFLVNRQGKVVARYGPAKDPKTLAPVIERLLDDPQRQ